VRCHAVLAVFVIALVAAAAVASSAAGAAGYATTVVVSLKTPAFHGSLGSPKAACKSSRSVRLYRVRSGPDKVVKSGTSNAKGRWSTPIGKKIPSGTYYAKAVARGNCKAGKSKSLVIP
jgi:hypothetical protein